MDNFKPKGTLKPYDPSLREKIGWGLAGLLEKLGLDKYGQQDVAEGVGTIADFIPGVGEAVGIDDTKRAYDEGDYLGVGLNAAGTIAGLIPGVGDAAGKVIKSADDVVEGYVKKKIKDMSPDELRAYKAEKQAEARAKKRDADIAAGVEIKNRGGQLGSKRKPVESKELSGRRIDEYADEIDPDADAQGDLVDELSSGGFDNHVEPDRIINEEVYLRGQQDRPFTEKDRRQAAADIFNERATSDRVGKSMDYHEAVRRKEALEALGLKKEAAGIKIPRGNKPEYRDRWNTQEIENPDGTKRLYDQNYEAPVPDPHKRYDLQGDKLHANSRLKKPEPRGEDWIQDVLDDIKRNGFEDLSDMPSGLDEVYEEAIRSRTPEGTSFTQGEGRVKGMQGPGKVEGDVVNSRYLKQPEYVPDESVLGGLGRRVSEAKDASELQRLRDQAAKMFGKKVVDTGEAKLSPDIRDLVKQLSPSEIDYMLKEVPFKERMAWVKARSSTK